MTVTVQGKEALILKLTHLDLDLNNHSMPEDLEVCPPGSVLLQGKGPTSTLVIRTTDGCVRATKVRPHGRKEQSADGFVNGYLSAHPTRRRVEGGWIFEGAFR
uniref:Formyl transferase C-terminal domain-containing protein n=1 Tax=Palpitomonas bilix TaxID=652834 RepID=A0A7S3GC90_9EUKA|mmetsp:Transcript_415/g.727  ORF Transcript_415/g.727 Transcript_415/m.727 type:complete len:103 (+) Transcript_415:28-336(+)